MPANLTPQYHKAEEAYRRAQTAAERLGCLEEMLRLIPKHKGTDHLQGHIRAKISEAKQDAEAEKKAGKKGGRTFRFPRQGAGTVVAIGAPSAGKSRLVAELTNAEPVVADYPFSTVEPLPGIMVWEDVRLQLIDTPPITDTHCEPYVLNMVRTADAVALCFDGSSDDAPEQTLEVVRQIESRKTRLSDRSGFDEDDLSIVHVRTEMIVTRADDPEVDTRLEFLDELGGPKLPTTPVELDRPESREELRRAIYDLLGVIRVYTKKPGKPAEMDSPFTIPAGGTVEDVAHEVHRDLVESLKFAKVWGTSANDGQTVGRDHALADGDVVELHA